MHPSSTASETWPTRWCEPVPPSAHARPNIDVAGAIQNYKLLLHGAMSRRMSDEMVNKRIPPLNSDPDDMSDAALTMRVRPSASRVVRTQQRVALRRAWRAFFDEWDILLCPQTLAPLFRMTTGRSIAAALMSTRPRSRICSSCSGPG